MLICDCPKCKTSMSILLKYVGRKKIPDFIISANPFRIPLLCSTCWKTVFKKEEVYNFRQV